MMTTRAGKSVDRNKVAERDGKARTAFNVSEQHKHILTGYDIVLGSGQIESTGRLVIARLKMKDATVRISPEFVLRWDEKANSLDVDPVNVSIVEARKFKKGTGDYCGHHPNKVGSNPRVFEVNIRWRGQQVYHGEIRFSLAREVGFKAAVGISTSISVNSSKGNA